MATGTSPGVKTIARALLAALLFLLICSPFETAIGAEPVPGSLKGDFSVSLGGSAQYSVPIAVPEGTSGMTPKLVLTYDSNAGPGNLGLGWSVGGLSYISRTPKTKLIDGEVAPIAFANTDGLTLDGSRLVPVGANDGHRLLSKAIDDQTRVEEVSDANGIHYIARTKAGLRMYYGDVPASRIQTNSGKVLIWPCVRIEDTFGNAIEFTYRTNGYGDWGFASAKYTSNKGMGLSPYAELRFHYHESSNPIVSYIAGEQLRRTLVVNAIESGVLDSSGAFKLFRRYDIGYDESGDTNRFGSRRVRKIIETGAYGETHQPTIFDYSEPQAGWRSQADYQLPTAFGSITSLEGGYRFIDLDSDGTKEIIYAANFLDPVSNTLKPYRRTYKLVGSAWQLQADLNLPEALATSTGQDSGAFFYDVDDDKLADFITASKTGADAVVSKAFRQEGGKWVERPEFKFPVAASIDGQRVLAIHPLKIDSTKRGFIAFDQVEPDTNKRFQFWSHDGSNWIGADVENLSNVTATSFLEADVTCDGSRDFIAVDEKAGTITVIAVDDALGVLKAKTIASIDLQAAITVQVAEVGGCGHLIVKSTAGQAKLLDVTYSSSTALDVSEILVGGVTSEDVGRFLVAPIDINSGDDVLLRLKATPKIDSVLLTYDASTKLWGRSNDYDLVINDESERLSPNYLPFAADINSDGKGDVVLLPASQILPPRALLNKGPGWTVEKQFVPDIAFAQKDKLGVGPQFVDLNGDSLIDLVGHFVDENGAVTAAASINTANGWIASDDYVTPMSLTNQKSGTTGALVDVTADGIADFVYGYAGVYKFWKNKFEIVAGRETPRYWVEEANFPPPPENFSVEQFGDLGVRFVDVNADSRVDMLVARRESNGTFYSRAYLNQGSSWSEAPKFRLNAPFVSRYPTDVSFETAGADYYRDLRGQLVDLNGDGLVDYAYRYRFSPSFGFGPAVLDRQCQNRDRTETTNGIVTVIKHPIPVGSTCAGALINTGAGWVEAADPVLPLVDLDLDITEKTASIDVLDINNDGLSDILISRPNSGSQTLLNTGAGWNDNTSYVVPNDVSSSNEKLKAYRFLDLNADGLIDVMYGRPEAKGAYLNSGFGWLKETSYAPPFDIVDGEGKDLGVRTIDVDGNGRPDILRSWKDENGSLTRGAYLNLGSRADTLQAVTNGMGLRTEFAYRSLLQLRNGEAAESQFYTPSPISEYPIISHAPTIYAVEKMTTIEAADRKLETTYRYKGFRFDVTGAMPLGFESREAKHAHNQLRDLAIMYQSYFLGGRSRVETTSFGSHTLTANTFDYQVVPPASGAFPVRVVMSRSVSENGDLNGAPLSKTTNSFKYDDDNNATETCVIYGDGSWTFTNNEYDRSQRNYEIEKWFLGRLTKSTITHGTGATQVNCVGLEGMDHGVAADQYAVSVATFTYNQDTGVLETETANATRSLSLTTKYLRDGFGNITRTERTDNLFRSTRSSAAKLDGLGRFVVSEINAVGHTANRVVDDILGVVLVATDPNGVRVENKYDGFGRLVRSLSPTGIEAKSALLWVENEAVHGQAVVMKSIEQVGALPPTESWMDLQGRVIRKVKKGFGNRLVYQDTKFDAMGRATNATLPYFVGEEIYWATTVYDELSRPTKTTRPDGAEASITYDGLSVIAEDPHVRGEANVRTTKKISNGKGLVIKTVDQNGKVLAFTFGPADRLLRTTQIDGREIVNEYDLVGNKIATTDPDLGHWDYQYNGFGEIRWQRDAKGQVTTIEYDALGRPKAKVTPDKRSEWTYDLAEYGKGSVAHIGASDGYSEDLTYDRFGRLERRQVRIEGELYATAVEYDEYSRVEVAYYPRNFAVKNDYDELGFLAAVSSSDPDQAFGTWQERWSAVERDQYGRVLREAFGNGIETTHSFDPLRGFEKNILTETPKGKRIADLTLDYDLTGNLITKQEGVAARQEEFSYDGLYRLTSWSVDEAKPVTYGYDDVGRILQKSDVGFYRYDATKPAHAVSEISAKKDGKAKWKYDYDANGNMVFGPKGHMEYYADNAVKLITASAETWSSFSYAPDGSRYMHHFRNGDLLTRTVTMGSYERVAEYGVVANLGKPDFIRHRVYVSADTGLVAVLERTTHYDPYLGETLAASKIAAASDLIAKLTTNSHYFTKDQLGSITHITDSKGVVSLAYRYDPWGKRTISSTNEKEPEWPGEDISGSIHKGFTGHEHLDHLDLVHMNGRIYDPTIARFISADPTLQFAMMGQNYDRYSYVINNPLRYTDPSGFGLFDVFEDIFEVFTAPFVAVGKWLEKNWRTVVVIVVAVVITAVSYGTLGPVAAGMLAGAASSGLGTALHGGSFSDVMESAFRGAVIGGISAGLAYGVGEIGFSSYYATAAAHGVTQGGFNAMQGGDFWQSFAAGAFGSLAGSYTQNSQYMSNASTSTKIAVGALAGGTGSVIGGGKFENGAITGAFVVAFNHLQKHANAIEALKNYVGGSGESIEVDLETISEAFSIDMSKQLAAASASDSSIIMIDEKVAFSTKGFFTNGALGNVTVRLTGEFGSTGTTWYFKGEIKGYNDTYDFDRSIHRTWLGELSTAVGATFPGRSFDHQFRGTVPVRGSGFLSTVH